MKLDRLDVKILDSLQKDATQTHATLGERVGLSGSAVRRRIEAMRKSGVIAREVAILGDAVARSGINCVVTVSFEKETRENDAAFRTAMRKERRVQQCYATSGQFDFVMIVSAESPEDYEAWAERTLTSNPAIRRCDSFVVWSTVKFTTERPVFGDFA